jgi:hypothetical protein
MASSSSQLNKGYTVPSHLNFVRTGAYFVSKDSAVNDKHENETERLDVDSIPAATIFNTDTTLIYRLPEHINQIENATVEIDLTNNHAVAATNAVWSYEGFDAAFAAVATVAGSFYQIGFPKLGVTTLPLAHDTPLATIEATIRALHPALASVTVGGALISVPGITTITMVSTRGQIPLENMPVTVTGYAISAAGPPIVPVLLHCWNSVPYAAGGSLKLGPAPLCLKSIEVYAGNTKVEEYSGDHLWFHLATHSREEETWEIGKKIGWDFDSNQSTAWINGASGTMRLYIPLAGVLEDQGTIIPALFPKIQWKIKITTRGAASILDSTSGAMATVANLVCTNTYLWITHKKYSPETLADIKDQMARNVDSNGRRFVDFRQYEFVDSSLYEPPTLTAGTEVTTKLGLFGDISEMFFAVRPQAKTNAQSWIAPLRLNNINVENGQEELLGDDHITDEVMRYEIMPNRFPKMKRSLLRDYNWYVWCPSSDPVQAKMDGKMIGIHSLNQSEVVKWTPTAAAASTTEIVAFYSNLCTMRIYEDGKVTHL